MRLFFLLWLNLCGSLVHAQHEGSGAWLNVDYTYSAIDYKEPSLLEKGRYAGVRGEIGFDLTSFVGLSVGGEYRDGNFNYDGATLTGSTIQVLSRDYIRDVRAMMHLFYGPVVIAGGVAEREWYENITGAYRRRETYGYFPATLTLYRDAVYVKVEYDLWSKGKNKSYMSDVGATEKDVEFAQSSGSGYGAEVGLMIPSAMHFQTRVFVAYHRWDVKDSDAQFDGVYTLVQPRSTTTTLEGGVGLSF